MSGRKNGWWRERGLSDELKAAREQSTERKNMWCVMRLHHITPAPNPLRIGGFFYRNRKPLKGVEPQLMAKPAFQRDYLG